MVVAIRWLFPNELSKIGSIFILQTLIFFIVELDPLICFVVYCCKLGALAYAR